MTVPVSDNQITILGGSGYIGRRLLASLRESGLTQIWAPTRDEIRAALADGSLFGRQLGRVYYCIGLTADFEQDALATLDAQAGLLARLTQLADYERLVYLSSTRLYDGLSGLVDERSSLALNPGEARHLYDLSKALGEHFVLCRSDGRGRVARLSSVYDADPAAGGFMNGVIRTFCGQAWVQVAAHPANVRDYIHVDDVISALRVLMDRDDAPYLLNVASGENVSNAQLSEYFGRHGYTLTFDADIALPPKPMPLIDIQGLRQLGIVPRQVAAFLQGHFKQSGGG